MSNEQMSYAVLDWRLYTSKTPQERLEAFRNNIINGNALDVLRQLPDNCIDCLVTSSPYYALRSYGTPPVIWPATRDNEKFCLTDLLILFESCEHDFTVTNTTLHSGRGGKTQKFSEQAPVPDTPISYAFCNKCDAWRGELGQEPTPDLFIDHLLLIGKEVFRVLKPTGTAWFNIGDTYSGSGGAGGDYNAGGMREGQPKFKQARGQSIPAKSLMGIPNEFANRMVRELGFILRNEIIWYKPNVMPQSAKDRFTIDFEKVFFFTKSQKYYFETQYEPLSEATLKEIQKTYNGKATKDYEANGVQNPSKTKANIIKKFAPKFGGNKADGYGRATYSGNEYEPNIALGRLKRAVWRISTKPFKGAHFAVYPKDLIRPMLQAGCPREICVKCGAPSIAIKEKRTIYKHELPKDHPQYRPKKEYHYAKDGYDKNNTSGTNKVDNLAKFTSVETITGHEPTCDCNAGFVKGVVLDPFIGSGTTRLVAQELGLDFIGIELKPEYAQMARERQYLRLPMRRRLYIEVIEQ